MENQIKHKKLSEEKKLKRKDKIPDKLKEEAAYNVENQFWSVFVSGLPYQISQTEVEAHFTECGEFESIFFPTYQDSGRSRGFAHIKFKTKKAFMKALKQNGTSLGSRYLEVAPSRGEKREGKREEKRQEIKQPPKHCKSIFISNLPYKATQDKVGDFFEAKCGKILNIRFVYHPVLKHFKGFGYIDFKEESSLLKALSLNGMSYEGRALKIDWEGGKAKSGYKLKFEQEGNTKYRKKQNEMVIKREQKLRKKERDLKKMKIIKGLEA